MNAVVKDNYEKLLLASLLLVLAATSIIAILTVRELPVPPLFSEGQSVEVDKIPQIKMAVVDIAVDKGPNSLEGFVYCRNSSCKYLINKIFQKCNWCKTPVVESREVSDDQNKNGISDKLELSWGLNLDDPKELLRDQDKDGFSTIVEHEMTCSPVDINDHPSSILRTSLIGIENKYIPFVLNDVVMIKDVKGNERIYVDAKHKTRGGFYLFVGEETDWLKILGAGEENGKKYALLKYFEQEVKIVKGERRQYEGWPKYILKNHLNDSQTKVSLGGKFSLKSLSNSVEIFKLMKVDATKKALIIVDQELDNKYEIGKRPLLGAPIE